MKYLVLLIMSYIMMSCVSNKNSLNCKIKKIIEFTVENEDSYYINVIFYRCESKELREILIQNELFDKYPSTKERKIQVQEYLGKLNNQYKYAIKVE